MRHAELTRGVAVQGLNSSCCGMMFNSRGFKTVAADKGAELEKALVKASEGGKYPIVCDTSPCLATIKGQLQDGSLKCAPTAASQLLQIVAEGLQAGAIQAADCSHVADV